MPDKVSPIEALPAASRAYGELGAASANPRWGMVVDLERCIGCWSCCIICKSENNVPLGMWWNRINTVGDALDTPYEDHGEPAMHWLPLACQHCENPACTKVCPVEATFSREDGLVVQDNQRCIGCRYCLVACPYGVRVFNWGKPEYPVPFNMGMVEPRPVGTMEKCTFCIHRLPEGQVPSCIWSCPGQARFFGDLNHPDSEVSRLVRERAGYQLLEERGTDPQVFYLPPRRKRGWER